MKNKEILQLNYSMETAFSWNTLDGVASGEVKMNNEFKEKLMKQIEENNNKLLLLLNELEENKTEKFSSKLYPDEFKYFIVSIGDNPLLGIMKYFSNPNKAYYNLCMAFEEEKEVMIQAERINKLSKYLERIRELNDGWIADSKCNKFFHVYNKINEKCEVHVNNSYLIKPIRYYFKSSEIGNRLISEFGHEFIKEALLA